MGAVFVGRICKFLIGQLRYKWQAIKVHSQKRNLCLMITYLVKRKFFRHLKTILKYSTNFIPFPCMYYVSM